MGTQEFGALIIQASLKILWTSLIKWFVTFFFVLFVGSGIWILGVLKLYTLKQIISSFLKRCFYISLFSKDSTINFEGNNYYFWTKFLFFQVFNQNLVRLRSYRRLDELGDLDDQLLMIDFTWCITLQCFTYKSLALLFCEIKIKSLNCRFSILFIFMIEIPKLYFIFIEEFRTNNCSFFVGFFRLLSDQVSFDYWNFDFFYWRNF